MYEKLVVFQEEHQHCMVPIPATSYESLGRWVRQQWTAFLEGSSQGDRKKALDEINFVCKVEANGTDPESSVNQRQWDEMFYKLVQFKIVHGHCKVPRGKNTPERDHVLSMWIGTQRAFNRKETLNPQRRERLKSIDTGIGPLLVAPLLPKLYIIECSYWTKNNGLGVL
jgi:hypothetical protein